MTTLRPDYSTGRSVPLPATALSPVGVALPATLPPAAAAALLPPNSAAMAAYLGAAAAAAQHSQRLMMTSPLPAFARASVSPLVTSSSSPPGMPLPLRIPPAASPGATSIPMQSPLDPGSADPAILDFSKKNTNKFESDSDDAMNLSKPVTPTPHGESNVNSPLDLSVSSRKRTGDEPSQQPPARKTRSSTEYKPPVLPPWPSPVSAQHLPYFAAAVAAASTLSPKTNHMSNHGTPETVLWNGKLKQSTPTPNDATKALEKMSELSKLGGEDLFRTMASSGAAANSASSRHSAWQSHWLNKGAEQAKDVLKCVWCKQSFPSLAAMTTHMKEAKHCGVNVPVPPMQPTNIPPQSHAPIVSQPSTTSNPPPGSASSNSGKSSQSDLNLLIKETMPLPRKLVRGQDVWLGKGAEQTRQILKCMWCGQSFRSLAEMTSHMQQTQHYTNIISQEQIISWKSSDDSKSGPGPGGASGPGSGGASGTSSHVSAVLTCKVCDQAFSSLKELSNHMVKNSHYKEHIMRSITESGGRRRQTREKRKKSLPVRKLLELERAQHDFKNGDTNSLVGSGGNNKPRDTTSAGRITCEKCGDKIETSQFVDHIRQCVGGGNISSSQRNFLKNALLSNNIIPPENPLLAASQMINHDSGRKSNDESPSPRHHRSPSSATDLSTSSSKEPSQTTEGGNSSSPSVLNAIEKLIEKSFDSRSRQSSTGYPGVPPTNAPIGSSILKRLGIDESVDYTKPLVDPQTMNLLRSYHHQNQHFSRRERSGSESSSVSERGSSRVDSLTPDRKMDPPGSHMSSTPRTTPDKRVHTPSSDKLAPEGSPDREISIKKEIDEDIPNETNHQGTPTATIKREEFDDNEEDERSSYHSNGGLHPPRMSAESRTAGDDAPDDETPIKRSGSVCASSPIMSPRQPTPSGLEPGVPNSPCRNSTCSPASSDRSGTPRSTNGSEKKAGGSLGALSSMFDSLSGMNSSAEGTGTSSGRRTSSHPLAALQKLCDKTETHHTNNRASSAGSSSTGISASPANASTSTPSTSSGTTPGAILAFSWACNDAVMTSDSIMKCAFCDTPFISKGAYRHHLSKMHFVKDGVIPDPVALKVSQAGNTSGVATSTPVKGSSGAPASSGSTSGGSRPSSKSPPAQGGYEESPHSKFLKYTELAKQLSSKYV